MKNKYLVQGITKSGFVVKNAEGEVGWVRKEVWNSGATTFAILKGFGEFAYTLEMPFDKVKEVNTIEIDLT